MKRWIWILALALGCDHRARQAAAPAAPKTPPPSQDQLTGAQLYASNCAVCHGDTGKGDGKAAYLLFPKPRDFTRGVYKVRSTQTGHVPTDRDLFDTISRGMPGSAMAGFDFLSEKDRWELVSHLKTLAVIETDEGEKLNVFKIRGAPKEIKVGDPPAANKDLVTRGKAVYAKMECAKCHGDYGRADGPSAATLKDEWGYPTFANDFTRGIYKGGGTERDIYLRFTSGMAGTPMPSFADLLSEEDRWALVYYVKSLAGSRVAQQARSGKLTASKVLKVTPYPFDPTWDKIEATAVPAMTIAQRTSFPETIRVKVVHDGSRIAVYMEWKDDTVNGTLLRHEDFTDAAATMFSMTDPPGHFTMGEKDKPCNLWHWKLDRQIDLGKHVDMEDLYPGMMVDDYPLARSHYPKRPSWPGHILVSGARSHDRTFLSGWGAGNQLSDPNKTTAVQDLNSVGFGTLEAQPASDQNVQGVGVWEAGVWKVVFVRTLAPGGVKDADLTPGRPAYIAFAVWDGAARDRDGQKTVTTWWTLEINK